MVAKSQHIYCMEVSHLVQKKQIKAIHITILQLSKNDAIHTTTYSEKKEKTENYRLSK